MRKSNVYMEAVIIKQEFLNRLPQELVNKMPKIHSQIIDEGVENLISGRMIYNDRLPETQEEYFIVLGFHYINAVAAFNGLIEGVKTAHAGEALSIDVNYRGENHIYHFEPKK